MTARQLQLADATATDERYAREWLEQQAVAAILEVDDADAQPEERRYRLPKGHDEVLLERDSLYYAAPLAQQMVSITRPLPAVLEAFKTGGGVPYPTTGRTCARASPTPTGRCSSTSWAPSGCPLYPTRTNGCEPTRPRGWPTSGAARGGRASRSPELPQGARDGFDLDEDSIAEARPTPRRRALRPGDLPGTRCRRPRALGQIRPGDRHRVHTRHEPTCGGPTGDALYGRQRRSGARGRRAGREEFKAPSDETERLMYGFSVLHCLPVGMAEQPSAGTGTVMRPATLRHYATEAGFSGIETLPIDNELWRFYRLVD